MYGSGKLACSKGSKTPTRITTLAFIWLHFLLSPKKVDKRKFIFHSFCSVEPGKGHLKMLLHFEMQLKAAFIHYF